MRHRLLVALLAVLAMALPAVAQEMRGSLEGVVSDQTGAAVPGVTVTARSASGAVLSSVTDSNGAYRFPSVAPGTYSVATSLTGFGPTKTEGVEVALGQTIKINLKLTLGNLTEEIVVTAETAVIDVKSNSRATNIRDEFVDLMPKDRDFTTVATQASGVNFDHKAGGVSIDGGSATENSYIIDGVQTNNLSQGYSSMSLVTDFVEEVQVKSSGYAAEYAGAIGGVINVITKSGTNEFKGSAWGYYSGDSLGYALNPMIGDTTASPSYTDGRQTLRLVPSDSTRSESVEFPKDSVTQFEPGFAFGGPIARDRAWFFASYNPLFRTRERTANLSDGTSMTAAEKRTQHFLTANVSAVLGQNTRVRLAYNNNLLKIDGLLPNPTIGSETGSTSPQTSFGVVKNYPNWSLSGNVDHVVSRNIFFGLRGGYFAEDTSEEGRPQGSRYFFQSSNVGMPGVPADMQHPVNYTNIGAILETRMDKYTRLQLQSDATFIVTAGGTHEIKLGVQLDRLGNTVDIGETGNRIRLYWGRSLSGQRGTYGYYDVRGNGVNDPVGGFLTKGETATNNIGLFLQDSWAVTPSFTVNLGVRTESEKVPSFAQPGACGDIPCPDPAFEFSFRDKLAPRVGFSWDVTGQGNWKVFGSWGRYYDMMKLQMPRGSFGADHWLSWYYSLDTPNWPTLDTANCPPACPGTLLRGPIDFRFPSFDTVIPDLQPYRVTEFSGGLEHSLSRTVGLSLRYVHKQVDSAIEDIGYIDADDNEIYYTANPGLGPYATTTTSTGLTVAFPQAKRDYDSVEVAFDKRLADNWALKVSALWSRLYGNYSGLANSDENGRVDANVSRMFDNALMLFDATGQPAYGLLPTDRTLQFKMQALYRFPFGLNAGVNGFLASGTPVTRDVSAVAGHDFPLQYLGRESDGRLPFLSWFDLNLTYDIKLGNKGRKVQLMANVLNLLGSSTATSRYQAELAAGQSIDITEDQYYSGTTNIPALIASQHLTRDPRFLQDTQFQTPRAVRLGLRVQF